MVVLKILGIYAGTIIVSFSIEVGIISNVVKTLNKQGYKINIQKLEKKDYPFSIVLTNTISKLKVSNLIILYNLYSASKVLKEYIQKKNILINILKEQDLFEEIEDLKTDYYVMNMIDGSIVKYLKKEDSVEIIDVTGPISKYDKETLKEIVLFMLEMQTAYENREDDSIKFDESRDAKEELEALRDEIIIFDEEPIQEIRQGHQRIRKDDKING